jgi:general secretion pathway protein F
MPRFAYQARDSAGQAVSATLDAPTRKDAARLLAARGLRISVLSEQIGAGAAAPTAKAGKAGAGRGLGGLFSFSIGGSAPPGRGQRLPFLESLHDLTSSGLSAGEAVRLLSVRLKEPRLRAIAAGLWESISEGASLSRAMADFPTVFDTATVNLIQAGEATGSLNDTLARMIVHLTEQRDLQRQLAVALAYPIGMICVAGGLILFFMFYLLPKLEDLLNSLGGKMPASTQLLVNLTNLGLHYGWLVLVAGAFAAISLWRWRATEAGKTTTDGWLLKLPLVGPFIVARTVLAFSQTLSVLLENGITASDALRMTERQITNNVHRGAFKTAIERVMEGETLSTALSRTGCLPDLVLDRLSVGENTGNVVPSLKQIAQAYRKTISVQLNVFVSAITTGVLMGVFLFVGFIAFAIVSAVFQVSASFQLG